LEIERSNKQIELNHDQLESIICKAFPGCKKPENWKILSGGAQNTVYRFNMDQIAFVLRLYASNRLHCKTEKNIHKLIDEKVRTPKLIYADELHSPWAYAIFEFISGTPIYNVPTEQKESLSYELGRTLASIHSFKLPEAGLFEEGMTIGHAFANGSSPYFEKTVSVLTEGKYIQERLGKQLVQKMLQFATQNKMFFPTIEEDHVCLTHADFKPVNLIYKEGKVYVLDWEFAHAGVGILDFAILLRHRNQFPYDSNALVKGYRDFGGTLPTNWFQSALLTDFVNIVTLLECPAERPQLFQQLKTAILETMNYW
jgi:aminoglycoside phosphotransferase (APT) family kinase protein